MFIFTAKFSLQRTILGILILGAVIAGIVLLSGLNDIAAASSGSSGVTTNERRVDYLCSFGWVVSEEPIEEQKIIIPKQFPPVYENYNKLQATQGFDLSQYSGREAMRYTYAISNYPGDIENVVADIIILNGMVIAGDVQQVGLGGFMHGLQMPE